MSLRAIQVLLKYVPGNCYHSTICQFASSKIRDIRVNKCFFFCKKKNDILFLYGERAEFKARF